MSKKTAKKTQSLKKKVEAPSSDSDSSDDLPLASKTYKRNIKGDCSKRFDFLLKQTEIFSHFITGGKNAEQTGEKRGRKKKQTATPSSSSKKGGGDEKSSRRRRKGGLAEDEEVLKGTAAQKAQEVFFDTTPHYIKNGEMRDYQLRGLNWMISLMDNGINGILADEMGLGKTLQTVSLLGYLKHFRENHGPHIVIVPKSTLQNWMNEIKRWCPSLTAVSLIGEKSARADYIANVMKATEWDVCVTTYDMCLCEKAVLKSFKWQYMVIDEAHRIKNENSHLAMIVRSFRSMYRLLLTGTPLQNNLHELWALLNFLLPDVFNNSEDFDTWFSNEKLDDQALVERLHAILKPFVLRRLKSEVESSLLPKKEIKVYVGMSKMQRDWYSKVLLKDIDVITATGAVAKMRVAMIMMHLRKVTNHPYLFDGAEEGPPYDPDLTHLVQNCGKMVILDRLLTRLKEEGSRVLLFSQMTRVLDILEDYCMWRGLTYHRLDGSTPYDERATNIDEFNSEGSPTFMFMLSTRAGGLGINLYTADSVIIYDSDWNPQADLQAIDRAHRIGQKKQVRVFRLITENTIDEKIIERADIKLRLDRMVIQKGLTKGQANPNHIDKKEMLNMIRFGAKEILNQEGSNISEEDIGTILQKCEARTQAEFEKLEQLEKEGETSLRKFTLDTPRISLFDFEGEDWKKKHKDPNIIDPFIQLPKRQRKMVSYQHMNDGGAEVATFNTEAPLPMAMSGTGPQPPKPTVQYHDFQFLPQRMFVLAEKEKFLLYQQTGYRIPITVYNQSNSNIAKYNAKIDTATPLTGSEKLEKQQLLRQGFPTWTRRHFDMFIQGLAEYGEADLASMTTFVEGKTLAEVEAYHKVFKKRKALLRNFEHIQQIIKAGEEQRLRKAAIKRNLEAKVKSYRQPFLDLKLKYPPLINSKYSEDADRFLVCTLARLGLYSKNVYAQLRHAVQTQFYPKTKNDLFLKTRTAMNLHERCDYLISLIQREAQQNGGKFVSQRPVTATFTGPVVELGSSDDEAKEEKDEEETEEIGINSDVVLIDSDSDTATYDYRKAVAASVRQKVMPKARPAVAQKKPAAVAVPADKGVDESSSGEDTEVEEVVPIASSDSEQFDLVEYLAKHGYQNYAHQIKRVLPQSKTTAQPKPKKMKLDTTATVTEIFELDDSSMDSSKSAKVTNKSDTSEKATTVTKAKVTEDTEEKSKSRKSANGKDHKTVESEKALEKNVNANGEETKVEPEKSLKIDKKMTTLENSKMETGDCTEEVNSHNRTQDFKKLESMEVPEDKTEENKKSEDKVEQCESSKPASGKDTKYETEKEPAHEDMETNDETKKNPEENGKAKTTDNCEKESTSRNKPQDLKKLEDEEPTKEIVTNGDVSESQIEEQPETDGVKDSTAIELETNTHTELCEKPVTQEVSQ